MKPLIPAIAAAALGTWALLENTALLTVSQYQIAVPGLPRLVQISDLHRRQFGRGQQRLIRTVAELKPELIVITGDLISRTVTDYRDTARLLKRLRALAPILMVYGNHELDLSPVHETEYRAMLARCGVRLLENESIRYGAVTFAGLTLTGAHYCGGGRFGSRPERPCTAEEITEALGAAAENTVLLAHNPLYFPAYAQWGARLTLAGHVHGGIVRLPLLGGILSPERRFFPRYDKGLFRENGAETDAEMVVCGGLGKLRLFNPPQVCLITEAAE